MQTLTLKAPAKINLYLNVLAKRPNGFHDIETIFEKIDLCDEIRLTQRKRGIRISCRQKDLPRNRKNLAFRAAEAFLAKANRNDGVEIGITKNIPVAAGLGGGSSDAASVLLGLNRLLHCGLSQSELLEIGKDLGADVSFFLLPQFRAIGRGKGELLTPLKTKKKNWYVLVIPKGLGLSSHRMYQALRITLTKRPGSVKIMLRALEKGDLTSLDKYSYNIFESIVRKKYKQVLEIKKALKFSGAQTSLMSGSGPCVFGITQTRKEAMDISRRFQANRSDWQVIVAKTYQMRPKLMERKRA
ncbi:MAG: 4-(cytidine 5'-diphospho)-2-C-methyl-D-erythritol kinase [Candidatus Omnitrophica bacterium]|nr:4-(cytidine 5'-diphospho)-2-C-methyl-D-erythritol kinase [Candidatus Omnitrophota bacterium]